MQDGNILQILYVPSFVSRKFPISAIWMHEESQDQSTSDNSEIKVQITCTNNALHL